jgi:hypothetical protein
VPPASFRHVMPELNRRKVPQMIPVHLAKHARQAGSAIRLHLSSASHVLLEGARTTAPTSALIVLLASTATRPATIWTVVRVSRVVQVTSPTMAAPAARFVDRAALARATLAAVLVMAEMWTIAARPYVQRDSHRGLLVLQMPSHSVHLAPQVLSVLAGMCCAPTAVLASTRTQAGLLRASRCSAKAASPQVAKVLPTQLTRAKSVLLADTLRGRMGSAPPLPASQGPPPLEAPSPRLGSAMPALPAASRPVGPLLAPRRGVLLALLLSLALLHSMEVASAAQRGVGLPAPTLPSASRQAAPRASSAPQVPAAVH